MKDDLIASIALKVSFFCMIAAFIGVIANIWELVDDRQLSEKFWMTLGVVFVASVVTLAVRKGLSAGKQQKSDEGTQE